VSRPLVIAAALAFLVAGVLPIAAMLARVAPGDLATLGDARTLALLGRTLAYGLGVAALAVVVGLPFGFLVARTDMPMASVLRPLGVVPLLLPPMILAMVWTVVAGIRGASAAYFVSVLNTFPLVALFAARAFERIDGRQEEAALLSGGLRAVIRADLPLVLPPALCGACLAFVFTVNDFSVPDYVSWIGVPKFNVYADEIFATWRIDSQPGRAVATALPLVALTLATLLPALALRRKGAMASFAGDFRSPSKLALGAWRWPAFAFVAAVLALGCVIPIGRLVYESGGGTRGFELAKLQKAFGLAIERGRGDLRNSIVWAFAAASLCVPIGLVLGHAIERARRGRWLEPFALAPIAVPAILFGIGAIVVWNHDWSAQFYDGGGLVVLLLIGRFVVFAILVAAGAVAMLDPKLEEAARVAGARPLKRLFAVVAPSTRSALAGAWVLVFVLAVRELDATILVPAANHTALFRIYNAVHFGRDDFVAAMALIAIFLIVLPGLLWSLFARTRLELLP
jgi:iron(III) transport system permease protein